jgi:hypothetical protein
MEYKVAMDRAYKKYGPGIRPGHYGVKETVVSDKKRMTTQRHVENARRATATNMLKGPTNKAFLLSSVL